MSDSIRTSNGTAPRSVRSSRPLAGLSVARTRTGLELEDALGTRFEGAALERNEAADASLGGRQERVEARAAEGHLLGRPLHLDELARAGHHDVHIHLGARVLDVVQVEHRLALDDADADRGDAVADRGGRLQARHARDSVGHGHEAAGDGRSAGAAVGLYHVAVHPDGALAELAAIDDGPQRPADEPLDLLRSPARPAIFSWRPRIGGAREHRVLGGDPALALAFQEGRHLVLDRRRADDVRRPELDEHRALGMQEEIARERDGAKLVGSASVGSRHRLYRVRVTAGVSAAARARWSKLRLYSARPAKMARAISSRYFVSLSLRSSRGLVTKPISSRIAGIAAPPST